MKEAGQLQRRNRLNGQGAKLDFMKPRVTHGQAQHLSPACGTT